MKQFARVLVLSGTLIAGSASMTVKPFINQGEAAPVYISNTVYQTTANLNMRSGAGTKYKVIITIPKGKQLTATERSGEWYRVTYSYVEKGKKVSRSGWVSGSYIQKVSAGTSKATVKTPVVAPKNKIQNPVPVKSNSPRIAYQTTANLNIRSGPSVKNSVVKTIPKGGIVTASDQKGSWHKVSYTYSVNKKNYTATGWVSGSYIKEYYQYSNIQGAFYFTKKETSLYPSPDKEKKAIFKVGMDNGFYSTQKVVNSLGEKWFKIAYNGKTAYVQSTDVTAFAAKSSTQIEFITNKDTYLFSAYGNAYSKLVKIPKDTRVVSSYSLGNWYKIKFGGKTGYIHAVNLEKFSPPATTPAPVQPAPAPVPEVVPPQADPVTTSDQPTSGNPVQAPELTETAISGKTYVTVSSLNLRKTAGTDSEILAVIPNAAFIFPTHKVSNGWFKLMFNGKTGYVSGGFIKEVVTGDPMNRDGYQFIDLRKPSKVTALQIDHYINNNLSGRTSVLAGKGQAFINAGNKYGVNALYLAAHAIHESGFGTSSISLGKYNLFGFGAFDATPFVGAVRFASIEQNIDYIAQEMKATYLNPGNWKYKGAYLGFSTRTVTDNVRVDSNSEGMNFYYASDIKWGQKIAAHMQKILPYNSADYNMTANTNIFAYPSRPEGQDAFPAGTWALAKQDIKLVNQKGSSVTSFILKKDVLFTIKEKHNDYWVKVSVDNKEYWTSDIKFDRYKEFVSVRNLGRVTVTSLNVRPTPSTSQAPIAALNLNEYIHLALDSTGNLIMDNSKTWYNVKLADGRSGWVSAQYIYQELK
jgi:mannosyl-glycoprotein endo-beta-N-acetylglucosaminidase